MRPTRTAGPRAAVRTTSALILISSAFLALLALGFWLYELHADTRFAHAPAIVERIGSKLGSDGNVTYYLQFRFKLPSGQIVIAHGQKGANPPTYKPGQTLRIAYNPSLAEDAFPAGTWDVYAVSIVEGVLAVILFDAGFASLWLERRRMKRNAMSSESRQAAEIAKRKSAARAANFWGGGRPE